MPKIYRVSTINNTTYYSRLKDVPNEKGEIHDAISVDAVKECQTLSDQVDERDREILRLANIIDSLLESPHDTANIKAAIETLKQHKPSEAEFHEFALINPKNLKMM